MMQGAVNMHIDGGGGILYIYICIYIHIDI